MSTTIIHPNTQLLLYLGDMKAAKNIQKGDILMGHDERPRIVMKVEKVDATSSTLVIPDIGDSFMISNDSPICVYDDIKKTIVSTDKKSVLPSYHLFSSRVSYQKQDIKNDPFLVGMIIGSKTSTLDAVIKEYLTSRLDKITKYCIDDKKNTIASADTIDREEIASLINHKYIPDEYLYNSLSTRRSFLAGFHAARKTGDKHKRSSSVGSSVGSSIGNQSSSRRQSTIKKSKKKSKTLDDQQNTPASATIIFPISDAILREQMKFLIRSLGIQCKIVDNTIQLDHNFLDAEYVAPGRMTKFSTKNIENSEKFVKITTDQDGRFLISSCMCV